MTVGHAGRQRVAQMNCCLCLGIHFFAVHNLSYNMAIDRGHAVHAASFSSFDLLGQRVSQWSRSFEHVTKHWVGFSFHALRISPARVYVPWCHLYYCYPISPTKLEVLNYDQS